MSYFNGASSQNIPIYVCPVTSTQAGVTYASNQNQQFVLQPIANNQQLQSRGMGHPMLAPMSYEHWWAQHTSPTDPTSPNSLYRQVPGARAAAESTTFYPQGAALQQIERPGRHHVQGTWHVGYLNNQIYQQQQRPDPDVNPMWSLSTLQQMDQRYREQLIGIPAVSWPSPAVGMTNYQATLYAAESSGIHVCNVDRNGYVQWIWQGTQ